MQYEFLDSCISCLDESISRCLIKCTCPGFVIVIKKSWPCGNEFHAIFFSSSGVLFGLELVKWKDNPPEDPKKENDSKGSTVSLFICHKKDLHGTVSILVVDCGFLNPSSTCGVEKCWSIQIISHKEVTLLVKICKS